MGIISHNSLPPNISTWAYVDSKSRLRGTAPDRRLAMYDSSQFMIQPIHAIALQELFPTPDRPCCRTEGSSSDTHKVRWYPIKRSVKFSWFRIPFIISCIAARSAGTRLSGQFWSALKTGYHHSRNKSFNLWLISGEFRPDLFQPISKISQKSYWRASRNQYIIIIVT